MIAPSGVAPAARLSRIHQSTLARRPSARDLACGRLSGKAEGAVDSKLAAPTEFRGRFSSFRAAEVAKSRAEGVPITLQLARRSAGGSAVFAAVLGVVGLIAFIGWPFALTTAIYAHEADSYDWTAPRIGLGLMAVGSWVTVVAALRWGWNRTSLARRRQASGLRDRALTRLGEAAADAAGAFDWDEIVLRDGTAAGPAGAVLRPAASEQLHWTAHVDRAWSELTGAIGDPTSTIVRVMNNGEIVASASYGPGRESGRDRS